MKTNSTTTEPASPKILHSLHPIVWGAICLIVVVLAMLEAGFRGSGVWDQWTASGELSEPKYTEAIHADDLFRTKTNTWSNLAYVVVGLYVIGFAHLDGRTRGSGRSYLVNTPAMSWLFGIVCCLLGVGSGLFHASLTRWWQQMDVASMYAPLVALIALNVGRLCPRVGKSMPSWPVLIIATIGAVSFFFVYKWSMSSVIVMASLILTLSGFVIVDVIASFQARHFFWFVAAIVGMALAITFRSLDIIGRFTGENSIIQGHALWHLLTGVSLACLYAYYRLAEDMSSRFIQNAAAKIPSSA